MVRFGILGPLEVLVDGEPVALGGPRQRAVLVRLLFDAGRVVGFERIIDDVWDGHPPPSAAKTLQKYVSELRKQLPDLTLRTTGGGYLLDVDARRRGRAPLRAAGRRRGARQRARIVARRRVVRSP